MINVPTQVSHGAKGEGTEQDATDESTCNMKMAFFYANHLQFQMLKPWAETLKGKMGIPDSKLKDSEGSSEFERRK